MGRESGKNRTTSRYLTLLLQCGWKSFYRMGVRMQQPGSRDAYKQHTTPEQWVEKIQARPDVHEEQADQWALLRHEIEGEKLSLIHISEPTRLGMTSYA